MDKLNILRVKAENVGFFENGVFDIDLTNQMQVTNYDEHHPYYNVGSTIYLPKVAVIKGVNASGKTATLEMLQMFVLIYFDQAPLKYALRSEFLKKAFNDNEVKLTLFFEQGGIVFKVVSKINSVSANSSEEDSYSESKSRYIITEEEIYEKTLLQSTTKKSLYDEGFSLLHVRPPYKEAKRTFLKDDESIISMAISETRSHNFAQIERRSGVIDQNLWLSVREVSTAFDTQIIQFFDPSIKKLIRKEPKKVNNLRPRQIDREVESYEVCFKNGQLYELTRIQLVSILSSGTMRGIKIFSRIKEVLKTGGLYIVDELELHLNKSIIADIIKLFNNPDTNPHKATLIFSTHYTEILDLFERNDQIFIVHRNEKYEIQISNYSNYDKKNQLKKSDAYFADTYELGTAISYDNYLELIKYFRKIHETN